MIIQRSLRLCRATGHLDLFPFLYIKTTTISIALEQTKLDISGQVFFSIFFVPPLSPVTLLCSLPKTPPSITHSAVTPPVGAAKPQGRKGHLLPRPSCHAGREPWYVFTYHYKQRGYSFILLYPCILEMYLKHHLIFGTFITFCIIIPRVLYLNNQNLTEF